MKSFAIYNIKGGVGKTTSIVNLAYLLATDYNKKVLVFDLDSQSNTTDFFDVYDTDKPTLKSYLINEFNGEHREFDITEIIRHTAYDNIDIVPAEMTLANAEQALASNLNVPQQFVIRGAVESIKDKYDYIIFDCSPSSNSLLNTNGLMATDYVFIPMFADEWTVRGMPEVIKIIENGKKYNPNLNLGGVFFSRYRNNSVDKAVESYIYSNLSEKLLISKIKDSTKVLETTWEKRPICEYAPKEQVSLDYKGLCFEIYNIVEGKNKNDIIKLKQKVVADISEKIVDEICSFDNLTKAQIDAFELEIKNEIADNRDNHFITINVLNKILARAKQANKKRS